MLLILHNSLPAERRTPCFLIVMSAATVLSGPQLYILGSAWVYHEPILWGAVLAAAFNLIVVRAALGHRGLGVADLVSLAVLAGLALNTRVSIGIALYLATVLLALSAGWSRHAPEHMSRGLAARGRALASALPALTRDPCILLPLLVLGLLAVAAGIVNLGRWGNAFSFGMGQYTYVVQRHPNILIALRDGYFNLNRIGVNLLYYATGIPYVLKNMPPFDRFLRSTLMEAPPLTPFLTNPLSILLAGVGLYRLWWKPDLRGSSLAMPRLALIGHACAVILILMFFDATLRYRFDLAPFVTLAALIGYRSVSLTAASVRERLRGRLRIAAVGLCVIGILGSHYILLVHKVWSIGVPMQVRLALFPFAPFAHAAFEP